jgi:uridine phosphorylase
MPSRLRPTASVAADAILVGDPGRALMLAQALLEQPKMSNHARGLWGYSGRTHSGRQLSLQATGMGGPSAALVLDDLAELGVRRAIRVGTCTALAADLATGELLAIEEAHGWSGGGGGAAVLPDSDLSARLRRQLGADARAAAVASFDTLQRSGASPPIAASAAADLQTAMLFRRGGELGVALAAVLVVAESTRGEQLADGPGELAARRAGEAAAAALSA